MRFYLTTPIYYVNSTPHIGHAYTTAMGDVLVRNHAQRGDETFFLTGVDEHATKVWRVAQEQGLEPQEYADRIAVPWRELPERLNASVDFFIRTSDEGHKAFVRDFLQRMYDNGDIYQDVYAGFYCVGCEAFKSEDELTEDGLCPIHLTKPEWIEETNYFFRLSAYQDKLLALYDARPDFVLPGFRFNEARSFIAGGLQDFSISRAGQPWGIPLPWDESQVAYVWADALINYLSALTYARDGEDLRDAFWPVVHHLLGQGHPPLPLRVLAGDAPLGRLRGAEAALRARLPAARRQEDLEVARQHHRAARADRRLRRRRSSVLDGARGLVRSGRQRIRDRRARALRHASSRTTSATCSRARRR